MASKTKSKINADIEKSYFIWNETKMTDCFILDSNIWLSSLLLRSPISLAFLHGIIVSKAKIGLPYVVEQEVAYHTPLKLKEILSKIKENTILLNTYLSVKSYGLDVSLPKENDLDEAFKNRLTDLNKLIIRKDLSVEQVKKSLDMVLKKIPPNTQTREDFKDSLIWQSVINYSKDYNVFFVTQDKSFYKDREYSKGMADNLLHDVKENKCNIKIESSLDSCTQILNKFSHPIDKVEVLNKILKHIDNYMQNHKDLKKFKVVKNINPPLSAYLTDNDDIIVINSVNIFCVDPINDKKISNGVLTMTISALYYLSKDMIDSITITRVNLILENGGSIGCTGPQK